MSDETRSIPPVEPVLDPKKDYVEINSYVVFWGLFYAAIFTLAVGYLCLKIGQTVDAFAPVSVLAMGTAVILKRQNAFAETVHIQAIASSSTNTLAGAMFFLPALYILECYRCNLCTNGDSYYSWWRTWCSIMRYVPSLLCRRNALCVSVPKWSCCS